MGQALRLRSLIGDICMYTWFAMVRTTTGGFMRVTVQADNQYYAQQMLESMYGSELLTEASMWNNP